MAKNDRYVTEDPKGGWKVKAAGAKRASAYSYTQAAAEKRAKEIIGNAGGGEVRVQGRTCRFRELRHRSKRQRPAVEQRR